MIINKANPFLKMGCLFEQYSPMRNKLFLISIALFFLNSTLSCQCPTIPILKNRFDAIYNSKIKTPKTQLKELRQLEMQMKDCGYDKDSVYTLLLQKIGVLYYLQSDFSEAVKYVENSIARAKNPSQGQPAYDYVIVDSYYKLIFYYDSLNQPQKSRACIDSCICYVIKKNTNYDIACNALVNKVAYLFNVGDYMLCSVNAALGECLVENYYHHSDSVSFINYFVNFYANSLYISHKIPLLEKLLKSREEYISKTNNPTYLFAIYDFLARINMDRNDFDNALLYFKKAHHEDVRLKYRTGISENLDNIGILYAKNFLQYDKGLAYCDSALNYAVSAADSLVVLMDVANIYALKGNYSKAQYFFQQSFNTLEKGINEESLSHSKLQFDGFNIYQDILDLITDKGNAYQQQYQTTKDKKWLDTAIQVFKDGDLFLTKLKATHGLQFESNLVWRLSAHTLYEQAIEACNANNDIENAFYFFEKSRAVLLNDQINEQHHLAETDIAKAAQSDQEINQLNIELQGIDKQSKPYLELIKNLYIKSTEREALAHQLIQKKPSAFQNKFDTSLITVKHTRKEILKDGTLLEIFTGDSAIYVLTIAPNTQSLRKLNKKVYDSLSRSFISLISHPALLEKDFKDYVKTAHQLYSFIFKNNPPPEGRLIISPDAGFFPFEALVIDENNNQPHYFLEKYAISYSYSVRYLSNTYTQSTTNSNNSILGIAPVTFNPSLHLANLSGSDVSLDHIKLYFSGANNMVKAQATKANFLQNFSNYNIIQLYTHAADSSFRDDPVIYFADSALYLSQLVSAQKPIAQLIVLSACETANGKLYQGEGVFSFNRSFAALGIPAAVSNLWAIDNESTYRLTELFYNYVAQGLPTDVALQKAKLDFIKASPKETQFPYYWAATVLVGKSNIISPHKNTSFLLIALFIFFLIVVVYFVWRKYIQQNK